MIGYWIGAAVAVLSYALNFYVLALGVCKGRRLTDAAAVGLSVLAFGSVILFAVCLQGITGNL